MPQPQKTDSPFARKPNGAATPPPAKDPTATRIEALESAISKLVASQVQANQTLASLTQQLAQRPQPQPAAPEPAPDPEEDIARLNQNPRAFLSQIARREAEEVARNNQGTGLQMADTLAQTLLDSQRAQVEARWGPEAWDKVVEPYLRPMVSQLRQNNPLGLANKETVGKLVSMAVGEHVEELSDLRAAHDLSENAAIGKAKESLVNDLRSQLPAPGLAPRRRMSEDSRPQDIPGLELMVKEHTAAGDPLDPDEVAAWHTSGNTLSDVLPLLELSKKGDKE